MKGIRVTVITEKYAMPRHVEDEMDSEPYEVDTDESVLSFRELVEATQEFNESSCYPVQGGEREWLLTTDEDWNEGAYIIKSLHLVDKTRAKYWRKAVLRRFSA